MDTENVNVETIERVKVIIEKKEKERVTITTIMTIINELLSDRCMDLGIGFVELIIVGIIRYFNDLLNCCANNRNIV